jgi:hypothetical protein
VQQVCVHFFPFFFCLFPHALVELAAFPHP